MSHSSWLPCWYGSYNRSKSSRSLLMLNSGSLLSLPSNFCQDTTDGCFIMRDKIQQQQVQSVQTQTIAFALVIRRQKVDFRFYRCNCTNKVIFSQLQPNQLNNVVFSENVLLVLQTVQMYALINFDGVSIPIRLLKSTAKLTLPNGPLL